MSQDLYDILENAREAVASGQAVTLAVVYIDARGDVNYDFDGKKQILALIGALEVFKADLAQGTPERTNV
jgi:hypothetical protein